MKKGLAVLLSVAMCASLTACGGGNDGSSGASSSGGSAASGSASSASSSASTAGSTSEEEITLQWVGAGWQANNKSDKVIAKWNELHPNVKVNYVELASVVDEEYMKNLDIMISGGEQVDITYLGIDDAFNRIMNGGALPVTEYVEAAGDDYDEMYGTLAKTQLSYNGELYGVPFANNTYKVFYNKTMMEEKGIEIPETWSYEEFTEIAKQVNDPDNGVYGCVFPSTWSDLCYAPAEVAGWQSVVKDADGNLVPNFEDEVFKKNMQWVYDLAETDKVSPSYATIKAESLNRRQALAQGDTAMIIDGPFTLVWLQTYMFDDPGEGQLPFEIGVADLPYMTEEAKEVSFNTIVGAFYVPKTSAYPEWAYEFEKFLCNECYVESANYMPTYVDADWEAATESFREYTDSNGEVHEDIYPKEVAEGAVSTPYESHVAKWGKDPSLAAYYNLMYTLFTEQYSVYLGGEMSLDDWCSMMQELAAAEIANIQ